jgi:hypothetical protein
MWDLWWTKWHWERVFSESFGFPLSISFHRCSILTRVSPGGWTRGLLGAQFHRDIVSLHRNSVTTRELCWQRTEGQCFIIDIYHVHICVHSISARKYNSCNYLNLLLRKSHISDLCPRDTCLKLGITKLSSEFSSETPILATRRSFLFVGNEIISFSCICDWSYCSLLELLK